MCFNKSELEGKTIKGSIKYMQSEKEKFLIENKGLRGLYLGNKQAFRTMLQRGKESESIKLKALLCPLYDMKGGISTDKEFFNNTSSIGKKMICIIDIINFLQRFISLEVDFIFMDVGLRGDNLDNIDCSINIELEIYKKRISDLFSGNFGINTFSGKINNNLDIISQEKSGYDFEYLLSYSFDNSDRLKKNISLMRRYYGDYIAYTKVYNYLMESGVIGDNLSENIIVNVEGSSLSAIPLYKGRNNMCISRENGNGLNMFVNGVLR